MVPDQIPADGAGLYPPLEPHRRGHLDVGGGHSIYFEESGNPQGVPVLFVHGGPGSNTRPAHRQYFDPDVYRIVLFDQRGCGQSLPFGAITENTTSHLVDDIEKLRRELGVAAWVLFGGSWGSTVSLAYATTHPARVAGMILRGVFLGSASEVDWFLHGLRHFIPESWNTFAGDARMPIVEHYRRLLADPRQDVAVEAARRWSDFEARAIEPGNPAATSGSATASQAIGRAAVQLHYMANAFFLRPDELLDNLWKVRTVPAIIVQGRLDFVCPPLSAHEVSRRLDAVELHIVPGGGHSASQPEMAAALCAATRRMKARLGA